MTLPTPDLLDDVLGLGPAMVALRDARPEVKQRTQTCAGALFEPGRPDGLSDAERFAAAARVATLNASTALAGHYEARLAAQPDAGGLMGAVRGEAGGGLDARRRAILAHVDRLALEPAEARPAHIRALEEAGLAPLAIVTLSQVVSFVSYQVRIAFALTLLGGVR